MDFNALKDVNNVKKLAKEIWSDIKTGFKNIKINKETFNEFFVEYLKNNYSKFDGRISRQQYWMFALYSMLIGLVLNICIVLLPYLAVFGIIYSFALLVPSICLIIRRLHDVNLSGWWFLISLVPLLGAIALLIILCLPSDAKANNYGEKA